MRADGTQPPQDSRYPDTVTVKFATNRPALHACSMLTVLHGCDDAVIAFEWAQFHGGQNELIPMTTWV